MTAFSGFIPPGSVPPSNRPTSRASQADGLGTTLTDVDDFEDEDVGRTVMVTFFDSYAATTKREQRITLAALADLIRTTNAATKQNLPWLKLARFGDTRTIHGSLRSNDNVLSVVGVEADYDGERLSFEEARDKLVATQLLAIIYTSPSHTEDAPRWRVICPTAQDYPPDRRVTLLARLNGLFNGVFSGESWVLSQSYYFGSVGQNPSHQVALLDGTPIDQMDHLDAAAIGRPKERNTGQQPHPKSRPEDISEVRIRGLVESLLNNIRRAVDGSKHITLRDTCLSIGGHLHTIGWSVEEGVEQAVGALPSADDWDQARDTARWAIERGMERPLDLEDRPHTHHSRGNGAAAREPDEEPPPNWGPEEPDNNPPPPRLGRILTGDAFISGFVPPDWLIDGVVQRGRLYACTSLTGHGKTATWIFNSCMIHAGRMVGHLDVVQGNVVFLSGENPEDLKARMHGMVGTYKLKPEELPYVLPGSFPLDDQEAEALMRDIAGLHAPIALLVGDTASSYFPGDDENNNVQAGTYARRLRRFTLEVPGNPTVVVLCHPVKNAAKGNLLPRGGGAFLNEVDGNLTLWSESQGEVTELHWQGKVRGPDFSPLGYRLRSVPTGFTDRRDRDVMTIVAEPMSDEAVADHAKQALANEDVVLRSLRDHPDWSWAQRAREAGWVGDDDTPERWRVQRAIRALAEDRLVQQSRKGAPWTLTPKGEEALGKDNP